MSDSVSLPRARRDLSPLTPSCARCESKNSPAGFGGGGGVCCCGYSPPCLTGSKTIESKKKNNSYSREGLPENWNNSLRCSHPWITYSREHLDPCLYLTSFAGSDDHEDQLTWAVVVNSRAGWTDANTPGRCPSTWTSTQRGRLSQICSRVFLTAGAPQAQDWSADTLSGKSGYKPQRLRLHLSSKCISVLDGMRKENKHNVFWLNRNRVRNHWGFLKGSLFNLFFCTHS